MYFLTKNIKVTACRHHIIHSDGQPVLVAPRSQLIECRVHSTILRNDSNKTPLKTNDRTGRCGRVSSLYIKKVVRKAIINFSFNFSVPSRHCVNVSY